MSEQQYIFEEESVNDIIMLTVSFLGKLYGKKKP